MKYRKKPIIIEAEQWFPGKDIEGVITKKEDLSFLIAMNMEGYFDHAAVIDSPEGQMIVLPGDWIITDIDGGKHACKSYLFEESYELVKESESLEVKFQEAVDNIARNHRKIIDEWCKAFAAEIYEKNGSIKPGDFILYEQEAPISAAYTRKYWFEEKNENN